MLLHLLGQHVVTMCVHTLAHQEAMLRHKHHKTLIVTILSRETHSQSSSNCREVWKYQGTCVSQYFLLWYCTNSQKHRFVSATNQLGLWTVPNSHIYAIFQALTDVDTFEYLKLHQKFEYGMHIWQPWDQHRCTVDQSSASSSLTGDCTGSVNTNSTSLSKHLSVQEYIALDRLKTPVFQDIITTSRSPAGAGESQLP